MYRNFKVFSITFLLFIILIPITSCYHQTSLPIAGATTETTELPTGWRVVFVNYGSWLWFAILWLLPLILSIVYCMKRKILYSGLWILLCFFTGWIGYIITFAVNNTRIREQKIGKNLINEDISKNKNFDNINFQRDNADSHQVESKYCMNCGEKLPSDAKFCRKCGKNTY